MLDTFGYHQQILFIQLFIEYNVQWVYLTEM